MTFMMVSFWSFFLVETKLNQTISHVVYVHPLQDSDAVCVCVYLIFYFVNHAVRCFLLLDSGCCSCILVVNGNDSVESWMGLVACVAYGSAHITKYLLTFCPSNFFHYAIPLQCRFQVVYFFLFIFLMIFFWCVDKFQYGFSWTRAQFKRLLAALSSVTVYFRKQQA